MIQLYDLSMITLTSTVFSSQCIFNQDYGIAIATINS